MTAPYFMPFAGAYELPVLPFMELANMWMRFCFGPYMAASNMNFPQPFAVAPADPQPAAQLAANAPVSTVFQPKAEIDKDSLISILTPLINERLNGLNLTVHEDSQNRFIMLESGMNSVRTRLAELNSNIESIKADSSAFLSKIESQLGAVSTDLATLRNERAAASVDPSHNMITNTHLLSVETALQELRNAQEKHSAQLSDMSQDMAKLRNERAAASVDTDHSMITNTHLLSVETALQELRNAQEKHSAQLADVSQEMATLRNERAAETIDTSQNLITNTHLLSLETAIQELRNVQQIQETTHKTHADDMESIRRRFEMQDVVVNELRRLSDTAKETANKGNEALESTLQTVLTAQQKQEIQDQTRAQDIKNIKTRFEVQDLAFNDLRRLMDEMKERADRGEFTLKTSLQEIRDAQISQEAQNKIRIQEIESIRRCFDAQELALNELKRFIDATRSQDTTDKSGSVEKINQLEQALTARLDKLDAAMTDALSSSTRPTDGDQFASVQKEWNEKLDMLRANWERSLSAYKETVVYLIKAETQGLRDLVAKSQASTQAPAQAIDPAAERKITEISQTQDELIETMQEAFMVFFKRNLLKMADLSPAVQSKLTARLTAVCLSPLTSDEHTHQAIEQGA